MESNQEHKTVENQQQTAIPYGLYRYWNDLQKKYHEEGWDIVEFIPSSPEEHYWRIHIDFSAYPFLIPDAHKQKLSGNISNQTSFLGNEDLVYLLDSNFLPPDSFWKEAKNAIQIKGFFMPEQELVHLDKKQLEPLIKWLRLKSQYFPFFKWINGIKEELIADSYNNTPIPIISAWQYFTHYVLFIQKISTQAPALFQKSQAFLHQSLSVFQFEKELPSSQCLFLLTSICESYYLKKQEAAILKRYLPKAHPVLIAFWKRLGPSILYFIKNGFDDTNEHADNFTINQLKLEFYTLCEKEMILFDIQSVLDHPIENPFIIQFPDFLQDQFGANRNASVVEKMLDTLGKTNIIDRIKSLKENHLASPKPHFHQPNSTWMEREDLRWYDLSKEEIQELQNAISSYILEEDLVSLKHIARKKQHIYLKGLLENYTAPFFKWEMANQGLIPQWNVMQSTKANILSQIFKTKRKKERMEEDRLRWASVELYQIKHIHTLNKLKEETKEFAFSDLQEKWTNALLTHEQTVINNRSYRIRRMKEFGILEEDEVADLDTEIWLDEMLQIEKEVTPFILFVKKAFQSALPMRKTTEFNPYRHSHDGIEFDPTTIQDQNKWMSGEVMKTLRTTVDKGNAEQINAFALDASGSMDHERMRNLFKILYLLILGLEDRNTYDAIHFFSTDFIEAANFTDQYTSRKLLFKVLKSISFANKDGVRYAGHGGTNISAAVRECHRQVIEFSEELQEKKPDILHLKSIFVITDGEPSFGIYSPKLLGEFIQAKREDGNIPIKGIFLTPEGGHSKFMEEIFGKDQFVESSDFGEAVRKFVYIMTLTYKKQRGVIKATKKQETPEQ